MFSKSVALIIVFALLFEVTTIVVAKNIDHESETIKFDQSRVTLRMLNVVNVKCNTGYIKINGHCHKIY